MKNLSLVSDRIIGFRPEIAKELKSREAAIVFQQLSYWSSKMNDDWFYKKSAEIQDETCMSRHELDKAVRVLKEVGWLETDLRKANGAPTTHYRILITVSSTISELRKNGNGIAKKRKSINSKNTTVSSTKAENLPLEASQLANRLFNHIVKRNPNIESKRTSKVSTWTPDIDKLNRLDGYSWQQIATVIDFAQTDDFWQNNILSGKNLRNNFERLILKAPQQKRSRVEELMGRLNGK